MLHPPKGKIISIVPVVGLFFISGKTNIGVYNVRLEEQRFQVHAWGLIENENGTTHVEPLILGKYGLTRYLSEQAWEIVAGL